MSAGKAEVTVRAVSGGFVLKIVPAAVFDQAREQICTSWPKVFEEIWRAVNGELPHKRMPWELVDRIELP